MAPNIPPGFGVVAHEFSIVGDPEPMFVTIGVEGAELQGDPTALAAIFHSSAGDVVTSRLPVQAKLLRTIVSFRSGAGPDFVVGDKSQVIQGGRASSNMLPQNCSWLLHKRTAVGGKTGRGRMYWPAVPDVSVNDIGELNTNEITDWETAINLYRTNIVGTPSVANLVLFHGPRVSGAAPAAPTPITLITCDRRIGTQRQRLRR